MQLFKGYVQNNDIPDVGSYIEAFSKDFEALFRIYSFTLNRAQVPGQMKTKIKAIKEERKKEYEEELKLREDSDVSDNNNEDEEEVEEEQKLEGAKRIEKDDKDSKLQLIDENENNVAYSKNVFLTLHKNIIPLNMYLFKMIFSQGINSKVQNKATDILIDNFAQREYFLKEVVKVELLITPEDEKINKKYKEHYERIEKLLKHLILDDLDYLLLHNFEKEKYRNRVKDATIVIKNVRSNLKREFNDKTKDERMAVIRKSQNILREFGVHKLMIE